ncbi:MAG TPA: MFS transporter [bacterium]|nr:MFS transporter [bacterium]
MAPTENGPHYRWNFFCAAANGVVFHVFFAIFNPATVIPVFVGTLTANPIWVALAGQLDAICWPLPQLFAASRILHLRRKLPFYRATAVARVVLVVALAALPFVVASGAGLLVTFLVAYGALQLAGGLAGPPFMDVVGKAVSSRGRGILFMVRRFGGGVLAVLTGVLLVGPVLRAYPFPVSYGLLFVVGAAFSVAALLVMSLSREREGEALAERHSLGQTVRRGFGLLAADVNYRRFVTSRVFICLSRLGVPFYIGLAMGKLELTAAAAGPFLTALMAGTVTSNLLWGYLSSRRGNRLLVRGGALVTILPPLLYFLSARAEWGGIYLFYALFFLVGFGWSGAEFGSINYLIDISPPELGPVYVGFGNTITGLAMLAAVGGGFVLKYAGYDVLFALAVFFAALSLWFTRRLAEPRDAGATPSLVVGARAG